MLTKPDLKDEKIIVCPSAKKLDSINFCLLDVSDFERIQRLKKRNT